MEKRQVCKCNVCGNVITVLHVGGGTLTCCDQPMKLLKENTTDAATEKHVPVITAIEGGYKVTVGEVEHPMAEDHYIQFIELIADGVSHIKLLSPGDKPVAEFKVQASKVVAREHCNLHGLWKAEA